MEYSKHMPVSLKYLLYNTILGIRDAPVHHVKGRPLYYLVVICTGTVC